MVAEERYELTEQEKAKGYSLKSWDGKTYKVTFKSGTLGEAYLLVEEQGLDLMKRILSNNGRTFEIQKKIVLWY